MPARKVCRCRTRNCCKANNGRGHELPSRIWNQHQEDDALENDRLENLTRQFAGTNLERNDIRQSLESAQIHAIQTQETDIISALVKGQAYPTRLQASTSPTPGQRLRVHMEEIEARVQGLIQEVEELGIPSLECSSKDIFTAFDHTKSQICNEHDRLKLLRTNCGSDQALLVVHKDVKDLIENSLRKLDDIKAIWSEISEQQYDTG
ncbi:hypothetical protein J132_09971 [Termitomyces sp. J132]|nr:hypothetical protein C0989_000284 [Termitomyces sp. Mn162]KNZ79436.1 hypothetical protein J132_09971 [Termitomyces sp. J132]